MHDAFRPYYGLYYLIFHVFLHVSLKLMDTVQTVAVPPEPVGAVWSRVANSSSQTRKKQKQKKRSKAFSQHFEEKWCKLVINYSLTDRQAVQCSWTEIGQKMNVSWTAAEEKWRSMQDWFPLLDTSFKIHPNMTDTRDCVVGDGFKTYVSIIVH